MSQSVADIEAKQVKHTLAPFDVGDQVAVAVLIREAPAPGSKDKADKMRVQHFIGDVIAIKGRGLGRSFTVRRIVEGEGVERVFPFHSPLVSGVEVRRKGVVRRAKLYTLRQKTGKAARIRERTGGASDDAGEPATAGARGSDAES